MFSKYVDFRFFFISFVIGIFYIYISNEHKKVIVMNPNPTNLEKYTYVDKANNCFQYELDEATCPNSSENYVNVNVEY